MLAEFGSIYEGTDCRERRRFSMDHDDRQPEADITYHFLHSTPEELAQLPPEELLQAALEERTLLQIIVGILNAPDKDPVLRIVAADLVYTQARLAAENQEAEAAAPMTYDIKRVSLRLGLSPTQVRTAYEQLNESSGIHILARRFPRKREQQLPLPLEGPPTEGH
ncbi:MAG: hypothetical protein ACJ8AG_17905 [Ktedonobacteraceae bacterium]